MEKLWFFEELKLYIFKIYLLFDIYYIFFIKKRKDRIYGKEWKKNTKGISVSPIKSKWKKSFQVKKVKGWIKWSGM